MVYDPELYDMDYIRVLERLQRLFKDILTQEKWLNASNVILKGKTPLFCIYTGKGQKVLDIIEAHL